MTPCHASYTTSRQAHKRAYTLRRRRESGRPLRPDDAEWLFGIDAGGGSNVWPRLVAVWAARRVGHSTNGIAKFFRVGHRGIQRRVQSVEEQREKSATVRRDTDALIAPRPTVTLTIEVGSSLWCLFDQIDMELDATWHALNFRAVADQGANG